MASERSQRLVSTVLQIMLRGLPVLLMAIVCGVTFLLVQVNTPQTDDTANQAKRHVADYTMDGISATALDETGATKYRFNGVHMTHYEDDRTYDVTYPALRVYAPDRPQVTARADLGKMNSDGTIIDLYNNAKVIRAQGPDARQDPLMTADSTYFQVLLNDDIVRTDKPVELRRGPSIMNANGLTFNNVTRQVQLLGNVRGRIEGLGAPKP
ncbi:LPS export ABC transporter periplasmic protein LptC [Ralstonia sp. SET104]|uniref:LPS export ABC transporter periplasmic protein LptC n=1 Tax=Ralstonia sp. SET104 TaxID=2448774 RepID=UPI000F5857BA|nr:LPS export ABC transporter periplasmic protein LptC [Ralstonia sp. SET104]GCB05084.1 LPS export ABC transporter periplasmic protein LptC [Ralstonia sp. SET104]